MSAIAAAAEPRSAVRTAARSMTFGLGLVFGAVAFGLLAGVLASDGKAIDVVGLALVLLPVALWKRPHIGPIVLLCTAVLFEQVVSTSSPKAGYVPGIGNVLPPPPLLITSHVHVFEGIGSIHLEGADLLLLMVALVFILRTKPAERGWPRSHVSRSMVWLVGAVLLGIFIGISHHGQMRVALMESRPYVYLAAAYVLTCALIRTRSAMRTVLWAFVIAAGVKAAQGVYEFFLVMNWHPRPEAVMGHEDAYTFGVYIFLVLGLWLFEAPMGRLRKVATWLLPVVIAANLFNNRRAAWLLLGGGLIVLAVIGYRCLPHRRPKMKKVGIFILLFLVAYIPAYWNKTGTFAQPARAIHSMISPDVRDAASNLYRVQEDANLKYNTRQGGVIGKGFGVPIDYALPIVDISKEDPNIKFIPHNGVLYIPMRMGLLGTIAMWALLGTGIIAGCRLARSVDREIAAVGALLPAALVAYALEGATDQGFYFYRIAFITGTLLGLAEAARRIQRTNPGVVQSWVGCSTPLDPGVGGPAAPTPARPRAPLKYVRTATGIESGPSGGPTLEPLPAVADFRTRRLNGRSLSLVPLVPSEQATSEAASGVLPDASPAPLGDMRAALVASHAPRAGVESEIERLAEQIPPQCVTKMIVLEPSRSAEPAQRYGFPVSAIGGAGKVRALKSAISLRRTLRRDQPTVVYADGGRAALASVLALVGTPIPIIWRRHDPDRSDVIMKFVGRRCRSVITATDVASTSLNSDLAVILDAFRTCSSAADARSKVR